MFTFDFAGNVPETVLETPVVPEVAAAVAQIADPPVVTPVAPIEPESNEYADYSLYSRVALKAQADKVIPEGTEIKKDLKPEELTELLVESIKQSRGLTDDAYLKEREELALQHLASKGYTEEHVAYAARLAAGASPEIISKHAQYQTLADATVESEEDYETLVRAALSVQGTKKDIIDAYVATLTDSDKLKTAAKDSQEYFGQLAEAEFKKDEAVQVERGRLETESKQRFDSEVTKVVENGFLGLTIPKVEQKILIDYIIKPSVPVDVISNGKKTRQYKPQMEVDGMDIRGNVEKLVALAHYIRGGMTAIVNTAQRTVGDKFLKGIKLEEEGRQPQRTQIAELAEPYMKISF